MYVFFSGQNEKNVCVLHARQLQIPSGLFSIEAASSAKLFKTWTHATNVDVHIEICGCSTFLFNFHVS